MTTQPTNNQVPSESPRDLKFNAGKIDEFVTSLALRYTDRFGDQHYTIEGLRQLAQEAIAEYGWIPVGTFQDGAELSLPNQILKDATDGEYYRWDGPLPKNVPENSTPESSGGTGSGAWISVGDGALRSMLASPAGASMIGRLGGGTVQEYIENNKKNVVYATADGGIVNDGVTDVSSQVKTFLNANKGKFIVFDSGTYLFSGVELSGSGWDGTTIYFKGSHLLSVRSGNVSNSFFGAWCGIVITAEVSGLTLYYRGDGNRSKQYDEEHIFNVAITGASNINMPYFEANEIKGDGVYVSRANPVSAGTPPASEIHFGTVIGKNSTQDGRNLVSIVSCIRGSINYFFSENVGGVVGGVRQPGGLDIEPNPNENFLVRDFIVNSATCINGGTAGLAMYSGSGVSNRQIQNCHIIQGVLRGSGRIRMEGAVDCSISFSADTLQGNGVSFEDSLRCTVNGSINGCETACDFGIRKVNSRCNVSINAANVRNAGVVTGGAANCDIEIIIDSFQGGGIGNLIGLWFRDVNSVGSMEQRNNNFKVIAPSNASRGIEYTSSTPINFIGSNVILPGSNFYNFTNYINLMGSAGQYLTKSEGIIGLTMSPSIPTTGSWMKGDVVKNTTLTASSMTYGWVRLTTGSGNSPGTDWGYLKFATS